MFLYRRIAAQLPAPAPEEANEIASWPPLHAGVTRAATEALRPWLAVGGAGLGDDVDPEVKADADVGCGSTCEPEHPGSAPSSNPVAATSSHQRAPGPHETVPGIATSMLGRHGTDGTSESPRSQADHYRGDADGRLPVP